MNKIIFATSNKDKLREVRQIFEGYEVLSMKEAGVFADVDETGATFEENALLKAKAVYEKCREVRALSGCVVMADDSGLEVDYLNKEPGIYSSRWMGVDTPYSEKCGKILELLDGVPDEKRSAGFVAAIAAVLPDGREFTVRGTMVGRISYEWAGENGFGYDPIFFLPEYGCTSAELSPEAKNAISHRGKGLRAMLQILQKSC